MPDEAIIACPACEYPLEFRMEVCPECGYRPTPDDRSQGVRREVFLELTRSSGWMRPGAVGVLAVVLALGLPLVLLILSMEGRRFIGRSSPRLHRKLVRRVYLIALPWWHIWWIAGAACFWVATLPMWEDFDPLRRARYFLSLDSDGFGGLILPPIVAGLALASSFVWRSRWRRLCAVAGVPDALRDSAMASGALRLCLYPPIIVGLVLFAVSGLVQLLDRLWPHWEMGP